MVVKGEDAREDVMGGGGHGLGGGFHHHSDELLHVADEEAVRWPTYALFVEVFLYSPWTPPQCNADLHRCYHHHHRNSDHLDQPRNVNLTLHFSLSFSQLSVLFVCLGTDAVWLGTC